MMKTREVAELLGVSTGTVLNYVKNGDFAPALWLSAKKVVFKREDVEAWILKKLTNVH